MIIIKNICKNFDFFNIDKTYKEKVDKLWQKQLEIIKDITYKHLKVKRYHAYGQCLTAVGWVGGTLPELYEKDGMIELSMADVAGGGCSWVCFNDKRPMYIIRYQGFNWFNAQLF